MHEFTRMFEMGQTDARRCKISLLFLLKVSTFIIAKIQNEIFYTQEMINEIKLTSTRHDHQPCRLLHSSDYENTNMWDYKTYTRANTPLTRAYK